MVHPSCRPPYSAMQNPADPKQDEDSPIFLNNKGGNLGSMRGTMAWMREYLTTTLSITDPKDPGLPTLNFRAIRNLIAWMGANHPDQQVAKTMAVHLFHSEHVMDTHYRVDVDASISRHVVKAMEKLLACPIPEESEGCLPFSSFARVLTPIFFCKIKIVDGMTKRLNDLAIAFILWPPNASQCFRCNIMFPRSLTARRPTVVPLLLSNHDFSRLHMVSIKRNRSFSFR